MNFVTHRRFYILLLMNEVVVVLVNLFEVPNLLLINIFSCILNFALIYKYKKRFFDAIYGSFILSIPMSFYSIYGNNYNEIPLSTYNILFVLFVVYSFFLNKKKNIDLVTILGYILIAMLTLNLIRAADIVDAIKDYLNLVSFIIILLISMKLKVKGEKNDYINLYIISSFSLAISVILQYILYNYYGVIKGKVVIYPNRIAFASIFSDFSFLSLLFASTASLFIKLENIYDLLLFLLFSTASVLTSARTGIVSLVITLIIYLTNKSKGISFWKISFLMISIYLIIQKWLATLRHSESLFNPTGRIESYAFAFHIIKSNMIWGVGLGVDAYKKFYLMTIPHNMVIQLLVQTGVIVTVIFILFLASILFRIYKSQDLNLFYSLIAIVIGAQFIPDIFNSRYFPVLLSIALLPSCNISSEISRCLNTNLSYKIQ